MGVLFEAGKLTSFALVHRSVPLALKPALLFVGVVLMALNVAGVSGFLSSAYEARQIAAQAQGHVAQAGAQGEVEVIERQVAAAEKQVAAANEALIKAKDNRGRVKAANALLTQARAERDALPQKLTQARSVRVKAEGKQIEAGGEFAAVTFIATAF
jgi:hypothetical protein